ncbi:MAG: glycosyltransferase family 39 protein [Bryobacter sp.]|nr:glycosyltransferase family 39 protein [Bryobacter sp.]
MNSLLRRAPLLILPPLALLAILLRLAGLDRSLWLDETWVANSVLNHSLAGMFYYEGWLQTTPPLFLLLLRASVLLFGENDLAFRLPPLLFSLASLWLFWQLLASALPHRPALRLLGWTLFAFAPETLLRATEAKQYSADAFAACLLLWLALRQRHSLPHAWAFLVAVPLCFSLSYASLFVLPACLFVLLRRPRFFLASSALAAATFLPLYFFLIQPNTNSVLRDFWDIQRPSLPWPKYLVWQVQTLSSHLLRWQGQSLPFRLAPLFLLPLLPAILRRPFRPALRLAVLPLLCLLAADLFRLYPVFLRTTLVLLPSLILLLLTNLALLRLPRFSPRLLAGAWLFLALAFTFFQTQQISFSRLATPIENNRDAVAHLAEYFQKGDALLLHASMLEPYRLYSQRYALESLPVLQAHTASPCCPRAVRQARSTSSASLLAADLARTLPSPLPTRLWYLTTNRADHWSWTQFDDRFPTFTYLQRRGCKQKPTPLFEGVGLVLFACSSE